MNTRRLLASLATLVLGCSLSAADNVPPAKPGYTVLLELKIDENGAVEDAKVLSSDDTSPDHVLDMLAFDQVRTKKLAVRQQDGHPVKYSARIPIVFPVEGDQGSLANDVPKPKLHSAVQPVYPAELAAQGEVGGAILDFVVDTKGNVTQLQVLGSSRPEFAEAATAAVKQWVFVPAMMQEKPFDSHWRLAVSFITDVRVPDWKWRFAPRPSLGNYSVMHRTQPLPAQAPEQNPAVPPADKK